MRAMQGQSAMALVAGMREGSLRATEVMAAHLDRIERLEPDIQAWVHRAPEASIQAAAEADRLRQEGRPLGPLHGLPVGVKDTIDTQDLPTEWGTLIHRGRQPAEDATIVARLREAGAIVIGKTVTSEYALFVPGPTRNPYNVDHTPGGSSSGSAAAVAAGMVPLALATQSNGSIIRPAAYCGVVGYKPSFGVLPRTGILKQSTLLDQPGLIVGDIEDVPLVTRTLQGRDPRDKSSLSAGDVALSASWAGRRVPRIAFVRGPFWSRATAETQAAVLEAVARMPASVDTIVLPPAFDATAEVTATLLDAGIGAAFAADFRDAADRLPDLVRRTIERGRTCLAATFLDALETRARLQNAFDALAAPYDAIISAATTDVAPLRTDGTGDPIFATLWTLLGAPALTLPLLTGPKCLPLGVQFVGGRRRDADLIEAATWVMRLKTKA